MLRGYAVSLSLVLGLALSACGGDDTVNPTDPDASSAKASDAGRDGSKDAAPTDAAKGDGAKEASEGGEGGTPEGGPDAAHDGETDAPLPD